MTLRGVQQHLKTLPCPSRSYDEFVHCWWLSAPQSQGSGLGLGLVGIGVPLSDVLQHSEGRKYSSTMHISRGTLSLLAPSSTSVQQQSRRNSFLLEECVLLCGSRLPFANSLLRRPRADNVDHFLDQRSLLGSASLGSDLLGRVQPSLLLLIRPATTFSF
jgi:hypothetical protein